MTGLADPPGQKPVHHKMSDVPLGTLIVNFRGEHCILSNFFPARVWLDGVEYATVEHAFQAAKTDDAAERAAIEAAPTPGVAKRLGKRVRLRPAWAEARLSVMAALIRQKFRLHAELREALLLTGDAELVEENSWRDSFWGVSRGKGANHLGLILMDVRREFRDEAG